MLEIEQAYGEFKDDPGVTRMLTELRALLEENPKPEDMDYVNWLRMHGATAKRIALKEVR